MKKLALVVLCILLLVGCLSAQHSLESISIVFEEKVPWVQIHRIYRIPTTKREFMVITDKGIYYVDMSTSSTYYTALELLIPLNDLEEHYGKTRDRSERLTPQLP
ncbi:MAG: hypothetical protein ACXABY_03750 [Candidatus Thorarchaeota archaeon]|jgi:hypothetical protein